MFGGGKGGRPREDPTLTTRGIREIKRQQKIEDKARKSREMEEKKRLWREGNCVAPDGRVASMSQVGREHGGLGAAAGRQAWEKITPEAQDKIKETGKFSGVFG